MKNATAQEAARNRRRTERFDPNARIDDILSAAALHLAQGRVWLQDVEEDLGLFEDRKAKKLTPEEAMAHVR